MLNRVAGGGNAQDGFTLRKIVATPNGNSYDVAVPQIGRYCANGGKPGFSYDERWLVYHHWVQIDDWASLGYASVSDPAFQALLTSPTANVFLLDLTTGVVRRITNMAPGQEALFPHFRSDGWIYFVAKGASAGEWVVASDAALVFAS
jgi:Tol biopolymer transport system component